LILTCEKCQRRYSVAEEMLRKAMKLRCKSCQHIISVPAHPQSGASPPKANAGRAARRSPTGPRGGAPKKDAGVPWNGLSAVTRPSEDGPPWFAMIKGRQGGPFQLKELECRVKAEEIGRRTYFWREGMTDWKRAEDLPELSSIFSPAAAPATTNHLRESIADSVQERPLPGFKIAPGMMSTPPKTEREADKDKPSPDAAERPTSGQPPPGEETRFFIAEAGVNKRNPPWKIGAFAVSLIVLPAAVLYLLAAFKVGPLVVTRIDASGHEIKETVFSSESSRLRELLSGRKQTSKPALDPRISTRASKGPSAPKPSESPPAPRRPPVASAELQALYADSSHVDVGPAVRKPEEKKSEESSGGLAQADVAKVVAQSQPAFQFCIEQEMKKNPSFKGGKIFINAVIGSSGTVKQASISRPDIDASSLGDCLKAKARRMVFASFSGDDTEVQIPLILTTSL
jgi:predicted Zn finger-like uncharacterized protein